MKRATFFLLALTTFARADAISDRMREFVDKGIVSGAVTLVATKDGVKHLAAVGKSDLASGREMKTDDLFWIASMTKPMTAMCVAMLAEEGKLSFGDPVEKHLPEFAGQWLVESKTKDRMTLVRPGRPITIRDLLTHTSGIGEMKSPRPHASIAELCTGYAREPLQFPPGSKWSYSNPGINTLGRIVEVVSGQPFAEFLQQRLFDPLGMKDTTFYPTDTQRARLATGYARNKDTGALEVAPVRALYEGTRDRPPQGNGGLFSTPRDYARFVQMLLNGGTLGGRRYLSAEAMKFLNTPQTGGLPVGFFQNDTYGQHGTKYGWGLGTSILRTPHEGVAAMLSPGSFGHGGAWGTQAWIDPVKGVAYVLMVQRANFPNSDASDVRRAFQQAAAKALR
jgi:CubicO group peptidase (beta-lactamase class C family)